MSALAAGYGTDSNSSMTDLVNADTSFADGQLAYRTKFERRSAPENDSYYDRTDWLAGWDHEYDHDEPRIAKERAMGVRTTKEIAMSEDVAAERPSVALNHPMLTAALAEIATNVARMEAYEAMAAENTERKVYLAAHRAEQMAGVLRRDIESDLVLICKSFGIRAERPVSHGVQA